MATFHQNLVQSFTNFKNKYLRQYDTYEDAVDDIANIPEGGIFYTSDGVDETINARNIRYDDGTQAGSDVETQIQQINSDLADIESTTLTLIDTITTINSATEYTFDFSAYKEIVFVITGGFSSTSNKWHVVHKYSLEEIDLIRNDTNYLCTEFTPNLPSLTIVGAVGNGSFVHINIGLNPNDDTKFKFQKNSNTYSFNELKIYGVNKVIS